LNLNAEDIPDILEKITEAIKEELLDKMISVMPMLTILDNDK